ncbi:hypothetical protein VI817_008860 [Penicillium citrinum]|nr:hypothetical protein VI817_008860 [Penicillium citrinum]
MMESYATTQTLEYTYTPESTPITTSSSSVYSPICIHSANPHDVTQYCVCDTTITHPAPTDGECPSTIPSDWIPATTTTAQSTSTSHTLTDGELKGYMYTYDDYASGGARIACETSTVSTGHYGLGTPVIGTHCAGSTTVLTSGVSYVTTATIITASPVLAGNWAEKTSENSDVATAPETMNSERDVLASSIYNALSTRCADTDSQQLVTTVVPTTTWNDELNSMGTITATNTMTACATDSIEVIGVWYLDGGESASNTEEGDLKISVTESYFTKENLDQWMWTTAFAYAYAAINHTTYPEYMYRSGYTGFTYPHIFAQHFAPKGIDLSYKGSFSLGADVEAMKTELEFEMSKEEEIDCEMMGAMIDAFAQFAAAALPELAPAIEEGAAEGATSFVMQCADHAGDDDI